MTKGFFPKLAAGNIRKNGRTYVPYIVSCVITVAMYYIICSLSVNPGLNYMIGAEPMTYMLNLGTWVVAIFSVIFLFYTSSFIIKRRKREFGLYNILGMEKLHLAVTMGWESIITAAISIGAGLILGIALDKVMYMFFLKIMGAAVPLGFFVSADVIFKTVILFTAIFFLIFLNSVRQVSLAKPIELISASGEGEKEPKTKIVMAVLGALFLGAGYYIALTTKNPLEAFILFFVAAVCVIIGTYLLFTAGSIALLKALRKNKRFYYKRNHFISVSGMIYRMKQNAAGLANICILSTMVLVMISTTSSMMVGMNDTLAARYPNDLCIYGFYGVDDREAIADVKALQKEEGISVKDEMDYRFLSFSAIQDGDEFTAVDDTGNLNLVGKVSGLVFVPLEDYNASMGENESLENGEVLVYANREDYGYSEMRVGDETFSVKETVDEFMGNGITAANVANTYFVVTGDMDVIEELYEYQRGIYGDAGSEIRHYYGFDTDASEEEQIEFYNHMSTIGLAESRAEGKTSFIGLYGGFFFIGVFLGALFIMATVLIIYYKQISEGYEDKGRFEIMQKVGLSRSEVKSSIRSQVLTVFFLPLVTAGIHTAVAFPILKDLLAVLNFTNVRLYLVATAGCYLVFAAMYVIVYIFTSRTYYRIVKR